MPDERSATPPTARELDGLPRAARLRRLWSAMPPKGRETAWARLDDEQRVEVVAAIFDAHVERERRPWTGAETRSAAQARWQAEADR